MKHSKRYCEVITKIEKGVEYELDEAIVKVKDTATGKFDETVEISLNLGVDPRKADQMIRSTVALPHGVGKVVRVLVLCKEDRIVEAQDAGADYAGADEYIEKIQAGWLEFDACIGTPDVMPQISKVARVLGPRGLMPNPKTGTVTNDITAAVKEIKAGRLSFRVDKFGIVHLPVGKASFENDKLADNIKALILTLQRLRPSTAKGQYFRNVTLASTMGPGVRISKTSILAAIR
jgi:large subunit ribosomal protein L1